MRKLTVKNFSVIKDAELEFGKITVLIGPQASGKSLLCKLAYFMGRVTLEIAIDAVTKRVDFPGMKRLVLGEFFKWFPGADVGTWPYFLEFTSGEFSFSIKEQQTFHPAAEPNVTFCEAFEREYQKRLDETAESERQRGFLLELALRSDAATRFMKLLGRGVWDAATYIPANRSFFVDTQMGYRALAEDPDPISGRFAAVYAESLNSKIPKQRVPIFLGCDLVNYHDTVAISFRDGRILPLRFLSSGSKEMLPIVSVLDMYEYRRRVSGPDLPSQELYGNKLYVFDDLIIEEPETGVFPQTQYELVREMVALSNETDFHPYFTITTHSPYVLSAFNNLIEAWQVGHSDPERHSNAHNVIDEKYWVNPAEFRAYTIDDGVLKSIVADDTKLISENYLDSVSETIGAEFDELLRIGYVEA